MFRRTDAELRDERGWQLDVKWENGDFSRSTRAGVSHLAAYTAGRRYACMAGVDRVVITAPEGAIAHEWDAHDNRWHDYTPVPQ